MGSPAQGGGGGIKNKWLEKNKSCAEYTPLKLFREKFDIEDSLLIIYDVEYHHALQNFNMTGKYDKHTTIKHNVKKLIIFINCTGTQSLIKFSSKTLGTSIEFLFIGSKLQVSKLFNKKINFAEGEFS